VRRSRLSVSPILHKPEGRDQSLRRVGAEPWSVTRRTPSGEWRLSDLSFALLAAGRYLPGLPADDCPLLRPSAGFDGRISMRLLMYPAAAAALSTVFMSLPAPAEQQHRHRIYANRSGINSGGFGTGPYWQGEPTDRLPIWRYGYYQGNDPDAFIRGQIIRDPINGIVGRSRR
jgi:hypothetical protein